MPCTTLSVHRDGMKTTARVHKTLRNLAISLNLEAAEILEHFQWDERLDNPKALAEELADVSLYLLQNCQHCWDRFGAGDYR